MSFSYAREGTGDVNECSCFFGGNNKVAMYLSERITNVWVGIRNSGRGVTIMR